ncbi:MAG: hypothetical protein HQ475_04350 [SAR202 cluster bacterium]|nr:hypothetical protein [SAR202 cluster bacterium]
MHNSMTFRSLSVSGFLAAAIAAYIMVGPDEGMLSGPKTVSLLLQSLPIFNF